MDNLHSAYRTLFGRADKVQHIFSPYRICPLGAHVDHQHGLVTGFAFDKGIDILFAPTDTGRLELCSLSFEGLTTLDVRRPVGERQHTWGDYVRGAVWALQHDFTLRRGVRGVVQGSMPVGGVSSSAALLCGIVLALSTANGLALDKRQTIHYASQAEREYVGLRNGILDQACVVLCEADKLLWLDTRTEEYELIPFGTAGGASTASTLPFKFGVFFSGVTRQLTGTDYNLRVSECKAVAWNALAYEGATLHEFEATRLRDVPEAVFRKHRERMPERFARRGDHFYGECRRVCDGVEAWRRGDVEAFGRLVFDSCTSSRTLYECGSPELIALDEAARHTTGIYGGRFSGAGFKGAYIALIDPSREAEIERDMREEYLRRFPQYADAYQSFFCTSEGGVRLLDDDCDEQ